MMVSCRWYTTSGGSSGSISTRPADGINAEGMDVCHVRHLIIHHLFQVPLEQSRIMLKLGHDAVVPSSSSS